MITNPKFQIGDEVRINPLATKGDFSENGCTKDFMYKLDETYIIKRVDKYDSEQYTCYLEGTPWNILEKCLIPNREDNEI